MENRLINILVYFFDIVIKDFEKKNQFKKVGIIFLCIWVRVYYCGVVKVVGILIYINMLIVVEFFYFIVYLGILDQEWDFRYFNYIILQEGKWLVFFFVGILSIVFIQKYSMYENIWKQVKFYLVEKFQE